MSVKACLIHDLVHSRKKRWAVLLSPSFTCSIVFLSFIFVFSQICLSEQLTGLEIMQRVDARERGKTSVSTVKMILIGRDGQQRIRKMKTFTKKEKKLTKKIIFFLSPANVKGTSLLTYDYSSASEEDDQWIFLPALHKTKRISAGNRSGSFMGSDFSYGDLTEKAIDSFSYRLIKEQQTDQHPCWIIEAIPKDNETVSRYGYSKSLLIVRQDNFVVIRAVHWLNNNKTLRYNEVTKLEQRNSIWVPLEVRAKTVANGKTIHQTLIITEHIAINQPINDELFTKRRLRQGI